MATTDLSRYDSRTVPSAKAMSFAIVVSDWNEAVTAKLLKGAHDALVKHGAAPKNIIVKHVPGSFEIPLIAQMFATNFAADAVICLGCVVKGETPHYEYINQSVAQALMRIGLKFSLPVIFGLLTTNTMEQAQERAGGKHGNKGVEAAITAIKMLALQTEVDKEYGEIGRR
ncbi:6,7-dimethyl-8-ribityllumazine synthase [Bacteroidia bacterium]|nr:6,7-dimethyl-8-ribityllumazine synthase [Bacteroidia bacterium]